LRGPTADIRALPLLRTHAPDVGGERRKNVLAQVLLSDFTTFMCTRVPSGAVTRFVGKSLGRTLFFIVRM
jgi:hypothetical protein